MDKEEQLLQGALAEHLSFRNRSARTKATTKGQEAFGVSADQEGITSGPDEEEEVEHEVEQEVAQEVGLGDEEEVDASRNSSKEPPEEDELPAVTRPATRRPSQLMNEDRHRFEAAKAYAAMTTASEEVRSTPARDGRGLCQQRLRTLVASTHFELFFSTAIVTNAVLIGVEVEYTSSNLVSEAPVAFRAIQHTYAMTFLLELLLRLAAERVHFFCSPNWAWNYLDVFIVLCSLWEVLMDIVLLIAGPDLERSSNMANIRILRIVRITRLIRITRISRLVRFIKALRTLVYSIMSTLKSLVWAVLLIGILIYVFGVFFTQVASEYLINEGGRKLTEEPASCPTIATPNDVIGRYWGTLGRSMATLFKCISGGVTWEDAVDPLDTLHWLVKAVFYVFISFAYFAVLNVVTGVFCQSAIESAQRDQDMVMQAIIANKKHHINKLRCLFREIDSDESNSITLAELEKRMQDQNVQAYFTSLELDVDDAWSFFKLLDTDRGHSIEIEEFLMGCMRLRGPAKALDFAKLMHEHQMLTKNLTTFMVYVERQFQTLKRGSSLDRRRERRLERRLYTGTARSTTPWSSSWSSSLRDPQDSVEQQPLAVRGWSSSLRDPLDSVEQPPAAALTTMYSDYSNSSPPEL